MTLGTGCVHGVVWGQECAGCNRVWGYSFMTAEQRQLAVFYNVDTKDQLIAAQAAYIEKLQTQIPPIRDTQVKRIREG